LQRKRGRPEAHIAVRGIQPSSLMFIFHGKKPYVGAFFELLSTHLLNLLADLQK
jgi:hypothetical protein